MWNEFNEKIATRTHRKENELTDDERNRESKRSNVISYQQSMHRNFRAQFSLRYVVVCQMKHKHQWERKVRAKVNQMSKGS